MMETQVKMMIPRAALDSPAQIMMMKLMMLNL